MLGVRAVDDGGQVALIQDVETVGPQPLEQAGGSERGGRTLLSGSARARARRDSDQGQARHPHAESNPASAGKVAAKPAYRPAGGFCCVACAWNRQRLLRIDTPTASSEPSRLHEGY